MSYYSAQLSFYRDRDGIITCQLGDTAYYFVMDFEGIGKNEDYTGPIRYDLKTMTGRELVQCLSYRNRTMERVSRLKVPKQIRDYFRAAIKRVKKGKKVWTKSIWKYIYRGPSFTPWGTSIGDRDFFGFVCR